VPIPTATATALTFREFIAATHPRYAFYPHLEPLIAALQAVADGELARLMVFMPPRHGKSETVSRLFPAYYLLRHPERWAALASYGADLAYTLSRAARDLYGRGGGALRDDAAAVKLWMTAGGGGLWAAGVGGPATGKGAHLAIVDDPIKDAEQAQSPTIREKHKDWWRSTWSTRFEPGAAAVVMATRWHEDDLSGFLLSQEGDEPEGWHLIDMPALAGERPEPAYPASVTVEPDPRPTGAALCPERYPAEKLAQVRRRIGDFWFDSLYQQTPRPRDGGLFSAAPRFVDAAPRQATRVRYWDKAGAAPGKGDYTVGALLAFDGERWYVEDVQRFQAPAAERNARIVTTAELDRATYGHVRTFVEQPPGLGKEATDAVIRLLAGFSAHAEPVRGDKVERAEPFAAQWQAGSVALVRAPWCATFVDELAAFPYGRHDDQVDAAAGAFRQLVDRPGAATAGGARSLTLTAASGRGGLRS
jgi:predicted phage terminase large subunit-like protein